MDAWQHRLVLGMDVLTLAIASYFFMANGFYTLLMLISLGWAWRYNQRRLDRSLRALPAPAVTPPVTVIIPAWNEQEVIVQSVRSVLQIDYSAMEIVVVDDGSTDATLDRLIRAFGLVRMDLIYRSPIRTRPVARFYLNPLIPNLLVIHKENGGKPDALNAGLNMCRTPYFCTLDSDCVLERDALLRLIRPVVHSAVNTVVSAGIIRILNGCEVRDGEVVRVKLPATSLERFQVVEYLRSFLFGRAGWNLLGATLIVSGAFALFHRETVIEAGGFGRDTVTEDVDLIAQLHRWALDQHRKIKMSFTLDPVCWTECPSSLGMLARQRRRWQMGLCQTLWKSSGMLFKSSYGVLGMLSLPFHLYVEGLGVVVELLGYVMVPLAFVFGTVSPALYALFVLVSVAYGGLLSIGAVLLEELTQRRYPTFRELTILLLFALLENIGYRQLVLCFRFQGMLRFMTRFRRWEKVDHVGRHAGFRTNTAS